MGLRRSRVEGLNKRNPGSGRQQNDSSDLAGSLHDLEFRSIDEEVSLDCGRLARHLARAGFQFDPSGVVRRFKGGLANINYLIVVDDQPMVLRHPPPGELPPGAHDMARESFILSRLSTALPIVPKSFHFCADASVIGAPFQLIEYRKGITIRGSDLSAVTHHTDVGERLSFLLVKTLADIHGVDTKTAGLAEFGRPDGFVERAIAGWSKRGRLVAHSPAQEKIILEVAEWLTMKRLSARAPTILHCDFKLDNVLIDPGTLQPIAVVDWDMGTRGNPLFDLATLLSYWAEPSDPDCMHQLDQMPTLRSGFLSRSEVAVEYARLTGADLSDLPVLRVLCMLKLGVVFLQLHNRWKFEAMRDQRQANFADLGNELLLFAKDIAEGRLF